MIMFFKMLCISFATVTLVSVFCSLLCSWIILSPKTSLSRADKMSDRLYEFVHVAQWTVLAAGVSGMVWFAAACIEYLWWME